MLLNMYPRFVGWKINIEFLCKFLVLKYTCIEARVCLIIKIKPRRHCCTIEVGDYRIMAPPPLSHVPASLHGQKN